MWDGRTWDVSNPRSCILFLASCFYDGAAAPFGIIYWLLVKYKKHPILYIGLAALVGIVIPM